MAMRKAKVKIDKNEVGVLIEEEGQYTFKYHAGYSGAPVSLTLPIRNEAYHFYRFPPFFDGLLPEGPQLDGLLRIHKIDRNDYFSQLLAIGKDLVGIVTVEPDDE